MLELVVTKSGDFVWVRTAPIFMRKEIARVEFEKWDRKREHHASQNRI